MRLLSLFLAITISVNIGCNKNTETATPEPASSGTTDETQGTEEKDETPAEHPAMTVANQVLAAIQAGDAAAMKPLLNATNQKKVSDDEIAQYLKEEKGTIGDVTQVTEVRKRQREGEVAAKIRVRGDEVLVVVLTLEEGQYRFEDINSPSVADYDSLEKIAP
jgi:hypothetical protein